MSEPCIYGCKNNAGDVRQTNNQDQICQGCAFDIHMEGHPRHMTPEQFKNFNREDADDMKKCDKCGTGAGPRAKACPKCGEKFEAKEKKAKVATKREKLSERGKAQVSAAFGLSPAEKKIGGGGDFKVLVDLSPYPKLYALISGSHFFNPGDLLLLLIKDRLAAAEADNVKAF